MKSLRYLCMMTIFFLLFAVQAEARETKVTVTNRTGKTIVYMFVADSGSNSWEDDILSTRALGLRTLENGYYCEFYINDSYDWDIRAEYRDGTIREYYEIDFRRSRNITLTPRDFVYDR